MAGSAMKKSRAAGTEHETMLEHSLETKEDGIQ